MNGSFPVKLFSIIKTVYSIQEESDLGYLYGSFQVTIAIQTYCGESI